MKKILLVLCMLFVGLPVDARADEYEDAVAYRDALREEIAAVDSEIQRCQKTLKGWKAATIIGGIGTVGTGVGLLLQNKRIKQNDQELEVGKGMLKAIDKGEMLNKQAKELAK